MSQPQQKSKFCGLIVIIGPPYKIDLSKIVDHVINSFRLKDIEIFNTNVETNRNYIWNFDKYSTKILNKIFSLRHYSNSMIITGRHVPTVIRRQCEMSIEFNQREVEVVVEGKKNIFQCVEDAKKFIQETAAAYLA